jgi:hypothetical protein
VLSIDYSCGSIVAQVVLPETISATTADAFASDVNTTAITVNGTNVSSIPGGVSLATATPQSSSGGKSSNSTAIAAGVVVALFVVIAIIIGVVIWKKKRNARDAPSTFRQSQKPSSIVVNPASKDNPLFEGQGAGHTPPAYEESA